METIAVLCACVLITAYIGWLTRDRCSTCPARERALEALISESAGDRADTRVDEIVYEWAQLQAAMSKEEDVITPNETKREYTRSELSDLDDIGLIHGMNAGETL